MKALHQAVIRNRRLCILRQAAQVAAQVAAQAAAQAAAQVAAQAAAQAAAQVAVQVAAQAAAQEGAPVTCQPPIRKKVSPLLIPGSLFLSEKQKRLWKTAGKSNIFNIYKLV